MYEQILSLALFLSLYYFFSCRSLYYYYDRNYNSLITLLNINNFIYETLCINAARGVWLAVLRLYPFHVTVILEGSVRESGTGVFWIQSVFRAARRHPRSAIMVLADLGRKITTALRSLSNATVINEEVGIN